MAVLVDKEDAVDCALDYGECSLRLKGARIRTPLGGVAGPSTEQLASARATSLRMTEFG